MELSMGQFLQESLRLGVQDSESFSILFLFHVRDLHTAASSHHRHRHLIILSVPHAHFMRNLRPRGLWEGVYGWNQQGAAFKFRRVTCLHWTGGLLPTSRLVSFPQPYLSSPGRD